jgi:ferredoxin--NADP+ reductase
MFDRLPTPFGLVRAGIAPDHQKTKQVIRAFERIAMNPRFRFFGNVEVGNHISIGKLQDCYDAVVLAVGAASDRKLGVQGEVLPGSLPATEFVGWYNGHPDFADMRPDLSAEVAVIVGLGNVTADLCRVLLGPMEDFARTDMAEHAIERLRASRIKTVHVVGRKGPADARFTNPELREVGRIADLRIDVDPTDIDSVDRLTVSENARRNLETFAAFASTPRSAKKRLIFHFHKNPTRILGSERVEAIELVDSRTSRTETIECGFVLRSVGNQGRPFEGVPFDASRCVVANEGGRVVRAGTAVAGLYVTGWAKRGPSGTVGTNRADSQETCRALLSDLGDRQPKSAATADELLRQLEGAGSIVTSYADWIEIDRLEIARGNEIKPREKLVKIADMIELSQIGRSRPSRSVSL